MVTEAAMDKLSRQSPRSAEAKLTMNLSQKSPHCSRYILFTLSLFTVVFTLYVVEC
jgi:hypothetical protein